MAADALAPYVARASVAIILTLEYVGPYLTQGMILSTCVISMWGNDIKYKCIFMFPLKSLARKGLINNVPHMVSYIRNSISYVADGKNYVKVLRIWYLKKTVSQFCASIVVHRRNIY